MNNEISHERYFADMTPYGRLIAPYTLSGVFNVGWIDVKTRFPTGEVPVRFVELLRKIICEAREGDFNALVEPIRESPSCEICGDLKLQDSRGWLIPNAELWIPADNKMTKVYASPVTILHFVEIHKYQPPQEYIDTVLNLDTSFKFNANHFYGQKLGSSDWYETWRKQTYARLFGNRKQN